MSARPMVRFENVVKRFGAVTVLDSLNLSVASGERLAIIGPSGSGKTTVLRALMTLEKVDEGAIYVDGEPLNFIERNGRREAAGEQHLRRIRGKIGMVFQHFNLFPHKTALGNVIEAPLYVLGLSRDEAVARGREYLDMVGLGDKLDAYPAQLSGGQKQRVGIARALAMCPEVMLFDEVTSALDPELVGGILQILRDLAARRTMTMIIVTHQMKFAERSSDRTLFFDEGNIVEDAESAQLFAAPREPRTQQFLQSVIEAA